jgi:hypothetical protein
VRLALRLPGEWVRLPVGDPGARGRIRELAARLVGPGDERAPLRIALRQRLEVALERSEAAGAAEVHVGIALETDVPMPAVASVYRGVPVPTAASVDADAVLAALVPLVLRAAHEPAGGTAAPGADDRVLDAGRSRILCRPIVRDAPHGAGSTPALAVDYWITVPGERRAALLHLDVPLVAPAVLLLALCDAIALAARFEAARSEPEAAGAEGVAVDA